jgi:hypothetical protein
MPKKTGTGGWITYCPILLSGTTTGRLNFRTTCTRHYPATKRTKESYWSGITFTITGSQTPTTSQKVFPLIIPIDSISYANSQSILAVATSEFNQLKSNINFQNQQPLQLSQFCENIGAINKILVQSLSCLEHPKDISRSSDFLFSFWTWLLDNYSHLFRNALDY